MGIFSWLFGRKRSADVANYAVAEPDVSALDAQEKLGGQTLVTDDVRAAQGSARTRRPYSPPPMTPERQRVANYYERERERAKASGRNVKQARAGLLGNDEAKAALQKLLDADETNALCLGRSAKGLTVALPDGRLLDPSTLMLRKFGIYIARIVGTSYYKAGEYTRPDAMELGLKREPDNEYDINAVALTRGDKRPQKLGFVAKGQAKHVAKLMDAGTELAAFVLTGGRHVLITTPEMWKTLNGK
ncbi:HIRAN domain-containing protein [Glutamicibacter ardleyensis]|uniref:HIRAN domain-containing protein n=1 Tax=Glutamicibacter ardleyensis TaxID=225894 RepID=UPI003FD46DB9